ncbi:uncharacterized protein EV420DRAFT_1684992 [Desarmillaria tabescens]|uniref:Sm protein G n=1 Tax=Armillaria tabescens TaxID=1929756 RepID=A0AA39TVW3_ARMTA|nr:uncharacterized protein EV420DRAFT_1684992 [Desarmillaria tabescens]KAK0467953.1 hypothetical protein EV420DRAFT_1684992 [Desarmillaria tabescens]
MSKASQPELKKFMDKRLFVHLQGGRNVSGTLRGYDLFLNLVIDDALEETTPGQKHPIGTVCYVDGNIGDDKIAEEMYDIYMRMGEPTCHDGTVAEMRRCLSAGSSILSSYRGHSAGHSSRRRYVTVAANDVHDHNLKEQPTSFHEKEKLDRLWLNLEHNKNPTRTWETYLRAVNQLGTTNIPLHFHQRALRACTVPTEKLRSAADRRIATKHPPAPHTYEVRFQLILGNIRTLGQKPDLEDYNFLLEQFAAAAHPVAALNTLKEMVLFGVIPRSKTYDEGNTGRYANHGKASHSCQFWLDPSHYDQDNFRGHGQLGLAGSPPALPEPVNFTTAALNNIVDMVGQTGNVSKLVQAFEVLTVPIPKSAQFMASSFDDDDDWGVSTPSPESSYHYPHASPNTTTYNLLIRHAIHLEREVAHQTRIEVLTKPLNQARAPHFAINKGTILPVFGLSNRDKNVGLMRWVHSKMPNLLKRKRAELTFFNNFRRGKIAKNQWPIIATGPSNTSTSSSKQDSSPNLFTRVKSALAKPPAIQPTPVKYIDLDLYIRILQRDIKEIDELRAHIEIILARTIQRVKERLGRRVWKGKNIYTLTGRRRDNVTRDEWRGIANFKPKVEDDERYVPGRVNMRRLKEITWNRKTLRKFVENRRRRGKYVPLKGQLKQKISRRDSGGAAMVAQGSVVQPVFVLKVGRSLFIRLIVEANGEGGAGAVGIDIEELTRTKSPVSCVA